MLVAERHEKITALVNEKGSIRVSELSQIFKVTEETIRRDLEKLENDGKLQRSHGGAVSIKDHDLEAPYFEREIRNVKEKMAVAEEAIKYVAANDRIILDASTTAWYMAKRLPDIPLTVLTNSMKVAMELVNREKISVITVGGSLLQKSLSFVGPQTNNALEYYHVNKAFISCQGIHAQRGISDSNEMQALVKKKMIEISDQVYLLADYTKFGVQAFSRISNMDAIHFVITDSKTNQDQIQELMDLPIKVIRS
ncbi:DeoR/GlpR family DNA-binding transcription regulator [Ureibacillus sinduriensis]|uniref:DeoR faimly transcriptional regulator n=1 Tax=Ureibacillus sinduriensis BLB-1 = JCM 15800 TaxID=1384057 RepID=A0A0A3HWW4_9BACL|nr:DeoR/GlpR family DNA-binding transcription regulator [Ureibacillus sinduriensis]KGR75710.1 DeoR faimly transcriptional regulator [Ureibacillus sinduriensis BLB-1 = JCM 15800]